MQHDVLFPVFAAVVAAATPVQAQTPPTAVSATAADGAASIPDFSRVWGRILPFRGSSRQHPFIFKHFKVQIVQQRDRVLFLYNEDREVRRVRLNEPHRSTVTPSWYGDSVGHYDGNALVIDPIGVKTDRPYAMLDLFGTPYTKSLHVVERYRLRNYDDVKDGVERNKSENC